MQDDFDIVRTWLRTQDHGWRSVVEERRDGTFTAGVEQRGEHGVTPAGRANIAPSGRAKIAADIDVRSDGHVCSAACAAWFPFESPASEVP